MKNFIYLIHAESTNRYKIGFASKRPDSRLKGLQTGCPFRLRLVASKEGSMQDEFALHVHFREHWVTGEWFAFENISVVLPYFTDKNVSLNIENSERAMAAEQRRRQEWGWSLASQVIGHQMGDSPSYTRKKLERLGQVPGPGWIEAAEEFVVNGKVGKLPLNIIHIFQEHLCEQMNQRHKNIYV